MGDRLIGADNTNPEGHFEDAILVAANDGIIRGDRVHSIEHLREHLTERAKCKLFGIKDPRLCETWSWVYPMLPPDIRIVRVLRPLDQVIRSAMRYYGDTGPTAAKHYGRRWQACEKIMGSVDCPRKEIMFSWVTANPQLAVNTLADFAFEGLSKPTAAQKADAMNLIKPSLYRVT